MLAPALADLADKYADKIDVYKVNTETEQELSAVFGIRSIPTLLFVPMQGKPQMAMGALPPQELERAVESVLLGGNHG